MKALRGLTIGIIGAGTMGRALLKGLLAQGVPRRAILASDPSATARAAARRLGLAATDDNAHVVRQSDVVILAVKPQQFPELMAEIASALSPPQLVISIAAGIRLRWLEARLPGIPLVRAMPNLTATVARGFSAIALGRPAQRAPDSSGGAGCRPPLGGGARCPGLARGAPRATARHRTIAKSIFGAVGEVVELPERYFDAITAVSGSGPAYVFFLVHMWEAAARSLGLPKAVAERAIRQTLKGSVRLLEASGEPSTALIAKVASKGGTTEAALARLAQRRVAEHFREALRAAANRSKALSL